MIIQIPFTFNRILDLLGSFFILISILLLIFLFQSNNKVQNGLLWFFGLINIATIIYVFGWVRDFQFWNGLLIGLAIFLFVVSGIFIFRQRRWAYFFLLLVAIIGVISLFFIPESAHFFMVVMVAGNLISLYLPFQKLRSVNLGKNVMSPAQDRAWKELEKQRPFSRT